MSLFHTSLHAMRRLHRGKMHNEYAESHLLYGWCYFPSVGTEIKCNNSLLSVRTDGNLYAYTLFSVRRDGKLQLNFVANYYT